MGGLSGLGYALEGARFMRRGHHTLGALAVQGLVTETPDPTGDYARLVDACNRGDFVLAADLLEYEIGPALEGH